MLADERPTAAIGLLDEAVASRPSDVLESGGPQRVRLAPELHPPSSGPCWDPGPIYYSDGTLSELTGRGITLGSISVGSRADFEAMNRAIAMHHLHRVIDRTFPFVEAKAAYWHFEGRISKGRGHFGKGRGHTRLRQVIGGRARFVVDAVGAACDARATRGPRTGGSGRTAVTGLPARGISERAPVIHSMRGRSGRLHLLEIRRPEIGTEPPAYWSAIEGGHRSWRTGT